ncbi:MAG TPA: gluconeogenesis factor YvcK family protein [Nevskiaceae bacterium]|nr:gluconeogenesis factor YvcK family protein [Nevskiaceae bacterium]
MKAAHTPNIVVIGGGTGSFAVLSGLRQLDCNVTALVGMADDGGSSGQLRDDLGVLPPGDVRQCLVALSDDSDELRQLFNFRFHEGDLAGHTFGNLFLSAVEKMTDDFGQAVRMAGEVLRVKGSVVPITLDNVRLVAVWADNTKMYGERQIDDAHFITQKGRPQLYLEPEAHINPLAAQAIAQADMVVIAPGDIYTSLGPLLVVQGMADCLAATRATVVYVCNLVTKPGHTQGFTVADHAAEIERFAGSPVIDYVLYNTAPPGKRILERYARAHELPVQPNQPQLAAAPYTAIGRKLVAADMPVPQKGDALAATRSFIRHDATKLAHELINLIRMS